MKIKRIAIIGLGLIGGSLAKSIKSADKEIVIAAYDYPDVLNKALSDKSIDTALTTYKEALDYDIIFVVLHIEESLKIFKELAPSLKDNQIISDLCSVKGIFADIWNDLKSEGYYIGAHPMAGKEKGGYQNSDNLLFENSIYIISDKSKTCVLLDEYINLVSKTGVRITFLNPYLHDKIISRVSHLPQLVSVLLVKQAAINENGINFIDFGAGGFRDMTRIASSDFDIWKQIIISNKNEIIASLQNLKDEVSELISELKNDDLKSIEEKFKNAKISRDEIPFNNKGFLSPLFDIAVFLKDEPGVIAKLSKVLFEQNINIKDLELLKIREGSGGNFRIYFNSIEDVNKAKQILLQNGFEVY